MKPIFIKLTNVDNDFTIYLNASSIETMIWNDDEAPGYTEITLESGLISVIERPAQILELIANA